MDDDAIISEDGHARSVVDRVLTAFVASLGAEEGFDEIAGRLGKTLLNERDMSDSALERALFGIERS